MQQMEQSDESGRGRAVQRGSVQRQFLNEVLQNSMLIDRYNRDMAGRDAISKGGHSDIAFDGRVPGFANLDTDGSDRAALGVPAGWVETGGLSLPIELPTAGQTLTFTKLGGDPMLTLSVRPRTTGLLAVRWLWAIVVLIAGAWLLHQLAHRQALDQTLRGLVFALVAVGLLALLCLPLPWNFLGGLLLVTGSAVGLHLRSAQAA